MAQELIITMTAKNRVGILSAVTRAMAELGADLREASQTVVRGFFTMIFSAEFPDNLDTGVIVDHLQDVCRPFGIEISVKRGPEKDELPPHGRRVKRRVLRLGGDNRPGVLRELSGIIAARGIDIVGMHAVRTRGGDGFEMIMKLAVPSEVDTEQLLADLNHAGATFHITAELSMT